MKVTARECTGIVFSNIQLYVKLLIQPDQKAMLVREVLDSVSQRRQWYREMEWLDMEIPMKSSTQQKNETRFMCAEINSTDVGEGIGLMAPRVAACAAHEANKVTTADYGRHEIKT